jgi:eukaryotic-like serine/threonine-protein kinase
MLPEGMGSSPSSPSTRTLGRYVVTEPIAAGGMATVHLARLSAVAGFSRIVAVKQLHAHLALDPEFVTMFLEEARLAARIRHPNVVSTLDVLSVEDQLLVIMDYVEGDSLARLLKALGSKGEKLAIPIALAVATDLLRGLAAAHDACAEDGKPLKIIHRDVSPQNALVGVDGVTRVADFGVAKAAGLTASTRGGLKGKVTYMPPEQLRGDPLDARADLYSAGLVLWEALTLKKRFGGENEWAIAADVHQGVRVPPSEHNPDVSEALDAFVMKSLHVDREQRFKDAHAMLDALAALGPVASPKEVGAWVRATVGDALAERNQRVAALARTASMPEVGVVPTQEEAPTVRLPEPEILHPASDSSRVHALSVRSAELPWVATRRLVRIGALVGVAVAALIAIVVGTAGVMSEPPPSRMQSSMGLTDDFVKVARRTSKALRPPAPARPPLAASSAPAVAAAPNKPRTRHAAPKPKQEKCTVQETLDERGQKRFKLVCK